MEDQEIVTEVMEQEQPDEKKNKKSKKNFLPVLGGFAAGVVITAALGTFLYFQQNKGSKELIIRECIDRYFLNEIDEKAMEDGKYRGMVEALGDEYSTYFTIDETEARVQQNSGTYKGVGVVLSQDTTTGTLTVVRCYPDSPAEAAGILPGDILLMVNGQDVTAMELNDVVTMIKESGDEGADLTMMREGEAEYLEFSVVPSSVQYPMVQAQMIDEEIGYLAIYDFTETTFDQFHTQLEGLKSQGMTRLIVDLRNNTGGLMTSVTDILDSILPEGIMVYTVDKNGNREDYKSSGKTPLEIPMVVLVNEYTASASEIFAGAVRDYDMAKLVGMNTFGKGIVQTTFFLTDGSAVKLTTASYYTPDGTSIHGSGLAPDVEVELNTELNEDGYIHDNQLEKAVEVIKEMK